MLNKSSTFCFATSAGASGDLYTDLLFINKVNDVEIMPLCFSLSSCWLAVHNNFIWAFVAPVCLVILVSIVKIFEVKESTTYR